MDTFLFTVIKKSPKKEDSRNIILKQYHLAKFSGTLCSHALRRLRQSNNLNLMTCTETGQCSAGSWVSVLPVSYNVKVSESIFEGSWPTGTK
jgi:hypothetical protein